MTRGPAALPWVVCFGALALGVPGTLRAQAPDRGVEFEDFGFTEPAEVGPRATALRAFAASTHDATALVLSTAGLARVQRVDGALVLVREESEVGLDYGDGMVSRAVSATRLQFAGVAFPVPVLRGSLVPALSVHRAFSSARDLVYARDNVADARSENYSLAQTGATYAYTLGVGSDLSSTLSAGGALFFLDGRIDALHQSDWVPTVPNPTTHTYVLADVEADVGGYGARIGAELYLHERFQIGLQFTSPTVVNVRAKQVREETQQVANDVGSFVRVETETDTEYLLPYRVEGAIAVPIRDFLVCAQFNYANWSEAAIDGQRVFTQQSDSVLRRTVGLAAGVEWRPAPTPLRLQAGFEYAPGALKYLQTDRIDNDGIERAEKDSGRTRVSAGAGWLVRGRLVLDAAFVRTQESREADLLADEYRAWQVSLQGTYWF